MPYWFCLYELFNLVKFIFNNEKLGVYVLIFIINSN